MDTDRYQETWNIRKPAVESAGGLVASQHHIASDIGARVLAAGGNAVDAAVAASLAIGTVEPWMSGLGGGGFMLIGKAGEPHVHAVEFGMVAPKRLDPADYPLAGGQASDLFAWPAVVDDRNVNGYPSIAVPGYVAGISLALETFGTRSWAESLAPAIERAEAGMPVDWYATLKIASGAQVLAQFDASRSVYLPDGMPPVGEWGGPLPRIQLTNLAATLKRLAEVGPRDFYEGEIAAKLVADLNAGGNKIAADDLASYEARVTKADPMAHGDGTVFAAPGLSAGPTLRHALTMLSERLRPGEKPDAEAYAAYAQCLLDAYEHRLATMGDSSDAADPSCTTHLSVVDSDGNLVALTQTLLSVFGSKVVLPQTGVTMNNGIMWFDPRPGGPNALRPGAKPLSNMCPTIVDRGDGFRFAVGGSGGRRILPAVFQLVSFLTDYGMDMDGAFHTGRVDASGTDLVSIDASLPADVIDALSARFNAEPATHGVYPALYACPNAVGRDMNAGRSSGASFVMSPWAKVSAG